MKLHIGCSGYYYRGWQGLWYPPELKAHRWFGYYAARFDTVEINASFYRFPTERAVGRWRMQAPEGFTYSIKAPRLITHMKRFRDCKAHIAGFYSTVSALGGKLDCVLFQMPPHLYYRPEALSRILGQLDPAFRNVCEFRHASWWCEDVYTALNNAGVIFCSVHAPGLPENIITTGGAVYLRLHGVPWYEQNYTETELAAWVTRIRAAGVKRGWVYFNNDANAFAPANALCLKQLVGCDAD